MATAFGPVLTIVLSQAMHATLLQHLAEARDAFHAEQRAQDAEAGRKSLFLLFEDIQRIRAAHQHIVVRTSGAQACDASQTKTECSPSWEPCSQRPPP